jgi:hypothetical protein
MLGVDDPDGVIAQHLGATTFGDDLDLGDAIGSAIIEERPAEAITAARATHDSGHATRHTDAQSNEQSHPAIGTSSRPASVDAAIELIEPEASAEHDHAPPRVDEERIVIESLEVDLSDQLATLHRGNGSPQAPPKVSPPAGAQAPAPVERPAPRDLESVFEDMRARVEKGPAVAASSDQFERAQRLLLEGRASAAIQDLQAAARTPTLRFKAAAQLGRLHIERGDVDAGIEWLERAAEAPAPSQEEGLSVLYDLASALERMNEHARALAVLMELEAHVAAYRDVRDRIEQLSRAQTGRPGA